MDGAYQGHIKSHHLRYEVLLFELPASRVLNRHEREGPSVAGAKMQSMLEQATVEEIVPLVEVLSPLERARLIPLITSEASAYASMPPSPDEFSADEDPLAWESDGWENVA